MLYPRPDPQAADRRLAWSDLIWFLTAAAIIFGGFYASLKPFESSLRFDSILYMSGAKALASGDGYVNGMFSGNPRIGSYPPLQSWLLSLLWRIRPGYPGNADILGWGMLMISWGAMGAAYCFIRRHHVPAWLATLFLANWAISPNWLQFVFLLMSDAAFVAIVLGVALIWLGPWPGRLTSATWALTGIGLGAAYLCRSAALPFLAVAAVTAAWQLRCRRWQPLASCGIPMAVALIGWRSWTMGGDTGTGYQSLFQGYLDEIGGWRGYPSVLWDNLLLTLSGRPFYDTVLYLPTWVLSAASRRLGPIQQTIVLTCFGLAFAASVGMAFWWLRKQRSMAMKVLGIASLLYFLQILVLPYSFRAYSREYPRLLFPLVAPLFAWSWSGITLFLAHPWRIRLLNIILACGLTLNLLWMLPFSRMLITSTVFMHHRLDEIREVADWVNQRTAPDATVAAGFFVEIPQLNGLTGRPILSDYIYPRSFWVPVSNAEQRNQRADYIVITDLGPKTNAPSGLLREVMRSSGGTYGVLRVDPDLERRWRKDKGLPRSPD